MSHVPQTAAHDGPARLFCPRCASYLGTRTACTCGWMAPAAPPVVHTRLAEWDLPLMAPPLLVQPTAGDAPALLVQGRGAAGGLEGGIAALELPTGNLAWQSDLGSPVTVAPVLAPDGASLLVASEDGLLRRLHARDGSELWAKPVELGERLEAPPLMPLQRSERGLTALTARGQVITVDWVTGTVGRKFVLSTDSALRCAAAPIYWRGDVLLVASDSRRAGQSRLLTLSAHGHLQVRATLEGMVYTTPIPGADGDSVFVGTDEGLLHCLNLSTGKAVWTFDAGKRIRATPLLVNHMLYFGSAAHFLYAVDARSGSRLWQFPWPHSINTTPILDASILLFADNAGAAVALELAHEPDASPRQAWAFDAEADRKGVTASMPSAAFFGSFIAHQGVFYGGSANGALYTLPAHGGNLAWAAERAKLSGRPLEAAAFMVAADKARGEAAAAQFLLDQQEYAHAAPMLQALGNQTSAAKTYEKAAEKERLPDYYRRASSIYIELNRPTDAQRCDIAALRMSNSPLLKVEVVSITPLKVHTHSHMSLSVQNIGRQHAKQVKLELVSLTCQRVEPVDWSELLADDSAIPFELDLVPTEAGTLSLRLVLRAKDQVGNALPPVEVTHSFQVATPDAPPIHVQIEKVITGTATVYEGDATIISRPPHTPPPTG